MSRIFNVDNRFFSVINKFVDLIFLSVIVDVMCIPALLTGLIAFKFSEGIYVVMMLLFVLAMGLVGPSLTALYYAVAKSVRHDRGYAVSEFFKSFGKNFRQGAAIGLIFGAFTALAVLDLYVMKNGGSSNMSEKSNMAVTSIIRALCVLMGMTALFVFPMLSRFNMKVGKFMFSALMMSIKHIGITVVLALNAAVFGAGPVVVAYFMGATSMEHYLTICIPCYLFLPGIGCLLSSYLIEKVFKPYIQKGIDDAKAEAESKGEEYNDSGEDRWYLE